MFENFFYYLMVTPPDIFISIKSKYFKYETSKNIKITFPRTWHILTTQSSLTCQHLVFNRGLEPVTEAASLLLKTCNYYAYIYTPLNYIDRDNNGENQ